MSLALNSRAWFYLFRPWSYTATLVPFLVAAGLVSAWAPHEPVRWAVWGVGFVVGLLFQATVNLLNTWGDERSGVDNVPGAIRTTPQVHEGLVSLRAVLAVALSCAALAALLGVGLCFPFAGDGRSFNIPLLVAGAVGCLGSLNYSTGIQFKYHGLGVPFVSFLMGPLEVFVACALLTPASAMQVLTMPHLGDFLLATIPVAALVGVVMHGNDMRDIPSDRAAGIVTFASALGSRGALAYYCVCHLLPYAFCVFLAAAKGCVFLLPFLGFPLSLRTVRVAVRVYRSTPENPPWRGLERASGGILFVFGILSSAAWFLGKLNLMRG